MTPVITPEMKRLADGIASVPCAVRDLASPEETERRRARIAAAQEARETRCGLITAANAIRRRHGIRTEQELLAVLNNAIASCDPRISDLKDKLVEFVADMEGPAPDESVESYYGPTFGEFDSQTVGVKVGRL